MNIFINFNVYNHQYNYDEMKVMCVLAQTQGVQDLDYEDLMRIVEAVHACWVDSKRRELYPWLAFKNSEENGYIQAYASRTLPYFIQLYKKGI